jgi:hypothetical protein
MAAVDIHVLRVVGVVLIRFALVPYRDIRFQRDGTYEGRGIVNAWIRLSGSFIACAWRAYHPWR